MFIHILAAATWVGGAILLNVINGRSMNSDDPQRILKVVTNSRPAAVLFNTAGIVTLLAGVGLVLENDKWEFSMGWILFALVVVIASALLGMTFYGNRMNAIELAADEHGPDAPQVLGVARQIAIVANVETVALLAVVWVMIVKPGV